MKIAILLLAAVASAATTIDAPSLGYVVYREPLELRPVLGIPGAARLGDAVELPEGTVDVRLSPDRKTAIVETEMATGVLTLEGERAVRWIDIAGPEVVFSPSGGSFALVKNGIARVYPKEWEIAVPGSAARFALSDDGTLLLAADQEGLWRIDRNGAAPVAVSARALAFAPRSHEAAVASGSAAYRLDANAALHPLAEGEWTDVVYNGSAVLLASRGARTMLRVFADKPAETIELPVAAGALAPLANAWLYSADRGEPAWILVAGETATSHFIPRAVSDSDRSPLPGAPEVP